MNHSRITAAQNNAYFDRAFAGQPIMGVFRGLDPRTAVERANMAWDLGANNVEIPVETPEAMPTLRAVISAANARDKVVGAGTIVSPDQVQDIVQAGALYTVSPGFSPGVAQASLDAGLPHLPGVGTASEILAARAMGLDWLKCFPGSLLGSKWITAMLGPFPHLKFVVTGGMSASNAKEFISAGARTIAVSTAFEDPTQVESIRGLIAASTPR